MLGSSWAQLLRAKLFRARPSPAHYLLFPLAAGGTAYNAHAVLSARSLPEDAEKEAAAGTPFLLDALEQQRAARRAREEEPRSS